MTKLIFALTITFCSIYSGIKAQEVRSITEGVSVQLYGSFGNWRSNSLLIGDVADSEPSGRGYGIELGYCVTPSIEVFANYTYENYNLSKAWDVLRSEYFSLGGRYYFGASRQLVRPYLNLTGESNNMKIASVFIRENNIILYDNAEMILRGFSGGLGGGAMYFPIPELAINFGIHARFGNFGNIKVDTNNYEQNENVDFRFIAVRLGAKYFFF